MREKGPLLPFQIPPTHVCVSKLTPPPAGPLTWSHHGDIVAKWPLARAPTMKTARYWPVRDCDLPRQRLHRVGEGLTKVLLQTLPLDGDEGDDVAAPQSPWCARGGGIASLPIFRLGAAPPRRRGLALGRRMWSTSRTGPRRFGACRVRFFRLRGPRRPRIHREEHDRAPSGS